MYQPSVPFFKEKKYKQTTNDQSNNNALVLAAYELGTPENAGAIIRLAGNIGVKEVWLVYDKDFTLRTAKIERVAQSSLSHVSYQVMNTNDFIKACNGFELVALETATESRNIFSCTLPKKCVLLAGNERFGLPDMLLAHCSSSVFIPLPGQTASMNVSHAITIAAFEWMRQHKIELMKM